MLRATTHCEWCGPYRTVVFRTLDEDGTVFLECEQCRTTFPDVVAGAMVAGVRSFQIRSSTSYATEPQIEARGWLSLIEREAPPVHSAQELIERAGWAPDRRVEVDHIVRRLLEDEHVVVPPFRAFMAQFAGLAIASDDGRVLEFDLHGILVRTSSAWCEAYATGIGRAVTPVAWRSHEVLLIDETGAFWGADGDYYGYTGDDIVQVVQWTLIDPLPSHPLDRQVPEDEV